MPSILDEQRSAPREPGPELMAASTLAGDRVVNAEGDLIGRIIEVMLDVRAGCIAYAVLAYLGENDTSDGWFVVPWSALTLDEEEHDFILDVDRDKPQHMPGFDRIIELCKRNEAQYRA